MPAVGPRADRTVEILDFEAETPAALPDNRRQAGIDHLLGEFAPVTVLNAATGGSVTLMGGSVSNEGLIVAELGQVTLASGQAAIAKQGQAPVLTTVVKPRDAVQWALYYPPVVDHDAEWLRAGGVEMSQSSLQRSLEAYRQGDLFNAYLALMEVQSVARDASLLIYRASLNLMVGKIDAAQ